MKRGGAVAHAARLELQGPPLDGMAAVLVQKWMSVQLGRGEGALSWSTLRDFTEITGERLKPDEAQAVIRIDHAYLAALRKPKPGGQT